MAKKRSLLPFQATNFSEHGSDNWNPNVWNWDSLRFVAQRIESNPPQLGTANASVVAIQSEPPSKASHLDMDDESLSLKLGGGGYGLTSAAQPVSRPGKKFRSGGSPGGASYPMCQVDDCKEDLSNAKDYHRRHKVCQVHSKATKALVAKQMQRFCQQCSRFHPLLEFDEGKRSCKRRLAGHNRRRRKTQQEDNASQALRTGSNENTGTGSANISNLLAALAHAQDLIEHLPTLGSPDKSIYGNVSSQAQSFLDESTLSPSTKDLLAVLSATPATPAVNAHKAQSQGNSQGSDSEKSKSASMDQFTRLSLNNELAQDFASVGGGRSSSSNRSLIEKSDCHVHNPHTNLPLQIFSSPPEIDSIPKLAADMKYFSSGSSNPSVDRSPSSSPAVAQKLCSVPISRNIVKPGGISASARGDANVIATRATDCTMSLKLFEGSSIGDENGSSQSSLQQAGYTSSSGSDYSPSSLNSDAQVRTGQIIFKLFDKDPSRLPGTLRTQIYNWLSSSPSEMESYIRPGCIVLSVYVSMSSSAWDQLEENLYQCIRSLVEDMSSDFWRNGRFLVHTPKQLASHKDGKIRVWKSWRVWCSPELISVSPVAVVPGQEASLLLTGRNLTLPATRISCTHTAGYTIYQVPEASYQQTTYEEINLGSFRIDGADPAGLGRCFIEVENGVRSTSFPVIIANAAICQELRLLESEFRGGSTVHDAVIADHIQESSATTSREETLHFLNELGWIFQRKRNSCLLETSDCKLGRFKFLLLFSVEHDFCSLVRTLLDILREINLARKELASESLEMLSEIHLLNRAVKRRCKSMVNLLLHYSVVDPCGSSKQYIFPPNLVGPGGITPLHLAASMSNSDDLVDALTSDPQEIGLHCWSSLLDSNGLSPYAYALMKNGHSYNRLVARKLADKENGQISVSIGNGIELLEMQKNEIDRPSLVKQGQGSCSKCAIAAVKHSRKVPGSQGMSHRSFVHSILAVAAVCVCVCLLYRGAPDIGSVAPFMWAKLEFGPV